MEARSRPHFLTSTGGKGPVIRVSHVRFHEVGSKRLNTDSEPGGDEHPRPKFSLKTLLVCVTLTAIGFAGFRFLVIFPGMLAAAVPLGIFIAMVVSLERLQTVRSAQSRVGLGCCLLPILFVSLGVLLAMLVTFLHQQL